MSQTVANYRWSAENFIRAWDAGAFANVRKYAPGQRIPVRYADAELAVDDLLTPA